jgi:hypothetical protein
MLKQHDVDSKPEDYPPHEAVAVSVLPECDICRYVELKMRPERALFDGKTHAGPWANMCYPHFTSHCGRLGLGIGQRLVIPGIGESMNRHPAGRALRSEAL